jgi:hypothetical protein
MSLREAAKRRRGNLKVAVAKNKQQAVYLDRHAALWLAMTAICLYNLVFSIISWDF